MLLLPVRVCDPAASQLLGAHQEPAMVVVPTGWIRRRCLAWGGLAAPRRAQELLSFAACYSHEDAAEALCTFLPSV